MPDGDGSFGIINTVRKEMCSCMSFIVKIVHKHSNDNDNKKVDDVAKILRT